MIILILLFIEANEEKSIYFQSTLQMLISSPPAVLILHLKRFQMSNNSTTCKITRNVSFQWILDIAPYCSVKCRVSNDTCIFLNTAHTLIFNLVIYSIRTS